MCDCTILVVVPRLIHSAVAVGGGRKSSNSSPGIQLLRPFNRTVQPIALRHDPGYK
jgi:hypothetical protein